MEKKKQSSVEWLVQELNRNIDFIPNVHHWDKIRNIIQQAKAMHRKEIEEAYIYGCAYQIDIKNGLSPIFYYKERFGDEKEVL